MDKSSLVRLFLDWGYTRLKVWIYDGDEVLRYEHSTFTSDLAKDPSFYSSEDISRVCEVIRTALFACQPARSICIYTSSQMHALAGTLYPGSDFISTWNDLPRNPSTSSPVAVHDGIPVLSSMPSNKISLVRDSYFLNSSYYSRTTGKIRSITSLSSPFALVLQRIFDSSIPCSRSWWQSTCLKADHPLIGAESSGCYGSETPVHIPSSYTLAVLGIDSSVSIYPEVGDLQASTYGSICESDVLLNLGTGSQIIFPSLSVSRALPYFRYYAGNQKPVPTISHIPCGRLLANYATAKAVSFSALRETMNQLRPLDLLALDQRLEHTLLCFPGFSFHDFSYHQQPTTSVERLVMLSAHEFLSIWVLQYYRILRNYLVDCPMRRESIVLDIVGDLGGLVDGFASLLARMLPTEFQLRRRASVTLPQSLARFHQASHWDSA